MRVCSKCGVEKPLATGFYKHKNYANGYKRQCKQCELAQNHERRQLPEVKERTRERDARYRKQRPRTPEQNFAYSLWTNYRMRPERYEEMLANQGGRCAICTTDEPGGHGRFHVDHDHSCCEGNTSCGNCVRALLCSRCNVGIAMMQDDPARLRAAADYIESAPAFLQALGSTV